MEISSAVWSGATAVHRVGDLGGCRSSRVARVLPLFAGLPWKGRAQPLSSAFSEQPWLGDTAWNIGFAADISTDGRSVW